MLFQNKQTLFISRKVIVSCFCAAFALLFSACVFTTGNKPKSEPETPTVATADPEKVTAAKSSYDKSDKKEDRGDFIVEHARLIDARMADLDQKIKREKLLEKAADDLNKAFILPNNIYLRSAACGKANAEFDPATQSITVCLELIEHFGNLFRSDGMKSEDADKKMFDAVRFAFLHEVGHALIHNYNLPVTGSEEDAADRCSSYINIEELGDSGIKAVLAAAEAFRIESKQNLNSKRDMSNEHLLQEQRFYNFLCMVNGSNPEKYEYLVRDGLLPKERAERCPVEYRKVVDSWRNLLEPWRQTY